MNGRFAVDLGWRALLASLGVAPADLLAAARLPTDLFDSDRASVDGGELRRLWGALEGLSGVEDLGLAVGQSVRAEMFSPPLMAAYASPDLMTALERLADYKPLIGPMRLDLEDLGIGVKVAYTGGEGFDLPEGFIAAELVFLVALARAATRQRIKPLGVRFRRPPASPAYSEYFGVPVMAGTEDLVVFRAEDIARPFVSANPALHAALAPELRARLEEEVRAGGVAGRLRAALAEALPAGQAEMGALARRLGMSARSLQRRLAEEGTSFQDQLTGLRRELAESYLANTGASNAEISYLLGYADPNSFIRAFRGWTGTTPEAHRAATARG